jgi:hypothetical protein
MEMVVSEVKIKCPFCLQRQTLLIEPDGGESQSIVYDCEVCCHPMDIQLHWNEEKQSFTATVDKSGGF